MKFTQKRMSSFDMGEYEVQGMGEPIEKTSHHFELNFDKDLDTEETDVGVDVDVHELYTQLAQKDRDLMLAAELGKALLEKNEELSLKYEQLNEDYSHGNERLEQEKHELRLKFERLESSYESRIQELQADLHLLRKELHTAKNANKSQEENKRETFAGLAEENERLHSDLHKVQSANEELKKQLLKFKRQLTRKLSSEETRAQWIEINELHEQVECLEEERLNLSQSIEDLTANKDVLTKEVNELKVENDNLTNQLMSSKHQLAGAEEELNESKHLNSFLQDQIDELKMQTSVEQTSLFSELSDLSLSMTEDMLHLPKMNMGASGPARLLSSSPTRKSSYNSNKRLRKHSSFGEERCFSIDSELDGEDATDGTPREGDVLSCKMKSEISEASVEIRSLYQAMQTVFGEGELLSTEALNPDMEFQPGCLTSVIKRMTELVEGSDQLGQTPNRGRVCGVPSAEELLGQVQTLEEELKQLESLREDLEAADVTIQQKQTDIAQLKDTIQEQLEHIRVLKDQRDQLARGECGAQLARDLLYQQAVQDREEAIKRESLTRKELEKLKEDRERLGQQLMEAIHQKLELSEQLEQWQIDVISMIDDQVKQQMKTAAKEQQQLRDTRTRRKSTFARRWNWPSSPSRRQSVL